MKASLLLGLILMALLCGMAAAKLSKKAQFKMGQKPSTHKKGLWIPNPPVPQESPASESDVDSCLAQLQSAIEEQAIWEEKRDVCLSNLQPLIPENEIYEDWTYRNRTLAIQCLLNLTQCNDENEPLVVDSNNVTRRQGSSSSFNLTPSLTTE